MEGRKTNYVIVTPVRDESAHVPKTIDSVFNQTIKPKEWVIVNDGSTDGTAAVIENAAKACEWLHPIHRCDRGYRRPGGGVVDAFNEGYEALASSSWDFIVKLDGDLSFGPAYFELCLEQFHRDASLGIGGGTICNVIDGKIVPETGPEFHVRGATKIYRRGCWEAIGGLLAAPGWDTLDEVRAQMFGWRTRTFGNILLHHHRPTGTADGIWRGLVKNGVANYMCGYHPVFMAAKCARRLGCRPYVVGAVALGYGFAKGYLTGTPQINDARVIQFVRKQQVARLLGKQTIWR
ncbi:MAG: glycosyltransferase family 2 protein [Bryobacterales bacterium]|nr:glycosyltransferase family 2 protein [Bryobacterales bacterium]